MKNKCDQKIPACLASLLEGGKVFQFFAKYWQTFLEKTAPLNSG
jgi:hypothetical protein